MLRPLSSLKILDFSTLLPGPFGAMLLADMGAEVLRVEAPQRPDMVRQLQPQADGTSTWHAVLNRNKRSIALDLKQPGAVEVVRRLVTDGGYDIVLEQFRPGVMDRLGVGYEALSAHNPRLIYCAITGYGQDGPYKDRAGHDINYLALSGMMAHSGTQAGGPPPLGAQFADIGGAMSAVVGILAAVIQRQQTGQGQLVDVAMLDTAVAWHSHAISHYLAAGEAPTRESWALNGGGFYGYYETEDGRFLSVGSLEPKFWHGFCAAIARSDLVPLATDPAAQPQLKQAIAAAIRGKPLAAWQAVFAELDVCVEPVLSVPEMLAHSQVQARGLVVDVPLPDGGTQKQIGSPLKFSGSQAEYRGVGTAVGAHTDDVLAEIGYADDEIAALREQGVVG